MFEEIFYSINLLVFYFWLIPYIGGNIADKCTRNYECRYLIQPNWVGYNVDLGDNQWREFKSTLPLLCFAAIFVTLLHKAVRKSSALLFHGKDGELTTLYHFVVGFVILVVQHGWHSIIVVVLICGTYGVCRAATRFGRMYAYTSVWACALGIIFLKESYRIQRYPGFEMIRYMFDSRFSGLYRWNLPANFLVLRLVSYCMDFCWAVSDQSEKSDFTRNERIDYKNRKKDQCKLSVSSEDHRPFDEYNLLNCLSYCLYAPLYVAGPIISFNSYMAFVNSPQTKESAPLYALRWCLAFVLMEVGTHMYPVFAVVRSGLYFQLRPSEMAVLAYLILKLMWLKFLLIWRFFRLWSLADGVLVPENMLRCMSNNCSLEQFWKGWHSSFNQWIVRYMYKPMGGRHSRMVNVFPIFFFVAIWHDIEPKLILWGGLNSIFYILEASGRHIHKAYIQRNVSARFCFVIETLSSASYIVILIAVNLIGYAVGADGVRGIAVRLCSRDGLFTVIGSFYFLSIGVCVMKYLKTHNISK